MTTCPLHKIPTPFIPCNLVEHVTTPKGGPRTHSICGLKEFMPKHTHCSDKNCANVSNLKHPAYTNEWKRKVKR